MIRLANTKDAQAILNIYKEYFSTPITFEYNVPSIEEFTKRIEDVLKEYPYYVYEEDGKILGYAYAHKFKERTAYGWDAEISIYIDKNYQSRGLGKALCLKLLETLKAQNVVNVYSVISVPNEKSQKLHESLGFKQIALYEKTGYKLNAWHDIAVYLIRVNPCTVPAKNVIPFVDL